MIRKRPLKDCEVYRGVYTYAVCAFDRQQALELFKEDFKDDEDIGKVKITRIHSEQVYGSIMDERLYAIYFRLDSSGIFDKRPNCEECGSPEVISKGISWCCKSCGRWFLKRKRRQQRVNRELETTLQPEETRFTRVS